ncbi:hypothetical protein ACPF8X_35585 [Streptomyces sp. G35A]
MTAQMPDDGGAPQERDGGPPLPEDVWQRFLMDDERSIRASAPREPSARQRAAGRRPQPPRPDGGGERGYDGADAVGDLWLPDDPRERPAWRDLDGSARLRRVGRVMVAAAAIALVLGAWSRLSTGAGTADEGPGDTVPQQSEDVPADLPTATSVPAADVSPSPSSPAVRAG